MDRFKASSGPTVETRITHVVSVRRRSIVDGDVREKTGGGGVCVSNQVTILSGPWCRRRNKPILQSSDLEVSRWPGSGMPVGSSDLCITLVPSWG